MFARERERESVKYSIHSVLLSIHVANDAAVPAASEVSVLVKILCPLPGWMGTHTSNNNLKAPKMYQCGIQEKKFNSTPPLE